jgi:secreted trypsin-like serine protease
MRLWRVVRAGAVGLAVMLATAAWTESMADPAGPDNRIEVVGGTQAGMHAFPWVVHLSTGCGGALIKPGFVLTAAHCVGSSASSITVLAGSADLNDPSIYAVRGAALKRAPGFDDVTLGNDWAVIRLRQELPLPTLALTSGAGYDSGTFTVMGWGSTSEGSMRQQRFLRTTTVPFVSDGSCGSAYRKAGYSFVPSDMLCAGNGGRDTCQGDSGGPMVHATGSGYVQVGIVSWGVGCARKQYPGVYTQVSHFAADIRAAVEDLS